ncbi:restriction endonuclease subunit S [Bifidobacterium adolescentis]|jgi:type I restriction enzyme S subunit|uniref:restriction endonuclease subunit S n=1 Tax=Bifidobacterium adolescentis TaxID=1680 RepID=UPI0006C4A99A|nr:restriction endonuclease subunit S [Bifidobacterium adolescentis]CUN60043.1 restriction endonuclease S subunit [Bifidobacterium adolescentis]
MGEPKLRFKADDGSDFSGWEEKTLGELCAPLTYGMNAAATKFDGENRYIRITDIDDETHALLPNDIVSPSGELDDKYLVKKGDILLARTGASTGKSFLYHPKDGKLFYAGFLIKAHVLPSSDDYFIYSQTLTDRYWKWVKTASMRSGQPGINANEYASYSFAVPSLPEQRKIADFLSAVDAVIAAQQAEVDAWEQRKKGVMQKLFSQEVRFKADDGSEFPAWESATVGELFTFVTEKNKDGHINNVITNSAERGLVPQREYFDKDIAVDGNTKGYTVIRKGDFVYNPRKSTSAPFGPFNIYERNEVGIVSPLYTCLTPYDDEMAPYLAWYFKTNRWHPYIVTHGAQSGARHDRVGMTVALMEGIPVLLPSLPEQRKIADCLASMDEVIQKSKGELAKWRELKKGLLQQMFV